MILSFGTDYQTQNLFLGDVQKKFSISLVQDKEKKLLHTKRFLMYTRNCEQRATIGIVKLTLQLLPQHNDVVPIKITGQTMKEHMVYFIIDEDSTKGRDPNINMINSIHNIKGKTSVNILVSNYTNKHIKFNKGKYIGHREPAIEDSMTSDTQIHNLLDAHSTNSVTIQNMMAEQVQLDAFNPLCHKLTPNIKSKLDALLKEYASPFAKDVTSIGTNPLMEMTIDMGNSDPVSQRPYLITMKNYQRVKDEIEKLPTAKVIHSSISSWSVPLIVVPKGDGGKHLVIDYCALNKVTRKFTWPMPKVRICFF